MNLSCPSCGVVHKTEEHPNAFEVQCVCGYSLLLPVEVEPSPGEKPIATFDQALPTSLEAEDDALLIRPEGLLALDSAEHEGALVSSSQGVLEMTPPDQLPGGMVYDSFELPTASNSNEASETDSSGALDLGNRDAFGEQNVSEEFSGETPQLESLPLDRVPIDASISKQLGESGNSTASKSRVSKAEALVERTQFASMGQFLGADYSLNIHDLSAMALETLTGRVQRIFYEHPWLENECKRRDLEIKEQLSRGKIKDVPELLALEIYLAAFELGGSCTFEKC